MKYSILILVLLLWTSAAYGQLTNIAAGTVNNVGDAEDGELLVNTGGAVTGYALLDWTPDGANSVLFANKFLSADIDGENAHGFFDNPTGGFTGTLPATNDGLLALDSNVKINTLFFYESLGGKFEVPLFDAATGQNLNMNNLQLNRLNFYNSSDDFVGARILMNSIIADTDYRLRFQTAIAGTLVTRIEIENLPMTIFTGGVTANSGIRLKADDNGNYGYLDPPATLAANVTWSLANHNGNLATTRVVIATSTFSPAAGDLHGGTVYNCTQAGGCVLTLPTAVENLRVCMYDNNGTVGLSFTAGTGDLINMPGGAGATATGGTMDSFDANVVGDFACVVALNASTWAVMPSQGTWTETP